MSILEMKKSQSGATSSIGEDDEIGSNAASNEEGETEKQAEIIDDEDYEEDDDAYLFRVYFKDDEIQQAIARQEHDMFEELMDMK